MIMLCRFEDTVDGDRRGVRDKEAGGSNNPGGQSQAAYQTQVLCLILYLVLTLIAKQPCVSQPFGNAVGESAMSVVL